MLKRTLSLAPTTLLLLGALSLSHASAAAAGAGSNTTRAGTAITNTGFLDYRTDEGTDATEQSNTVTATVRHVPAVSITPNGGTDGGNDPSTPVCGQTVIGVPGQAAVLTYQITNTSNGPDTYTLTTLLGNNSPTGAAAQYYLDDGDGTFTPQDTEVTSIALDVGESRTFFVTYPIAAGEAGTSQFTLSPVATSTADNTVSDSGNTGCVDTQDRVGVKLDNDNFRETTAPATVQTEHLLRNIGNVTLNAGTITLTPQPGRYPTTYRFGNQTTEYPTPQDALTAYGDLPMGQGVTLHVTQQVPAGEANATRSTLRLQASTPGDSTPERENLTPADASDARTDEVYVTRGIARIQKTQALCELADDGTLNCPSAQQMYDRQGIYRRALEVQPCSVIKYALFAQNTGEALLKQARIRDVIPENTTLLGTVALSSSSTLYRVNGGAWTADAPADQPAGTTIEVAPDLDGDGTITDADGLPRNSNNSGAVLYVQVKGPNCVKPDLFPIEDINNFQAT
ncbi:hypothetical protein [Deinococcus petrolearius]|uniref:Uncharacterized protein n=1 Tax=Deinococcus petrolearius TaxID=1751295 RepID=A0ABW1DMZ4_9DEIO